MTTTSNILICGDVHGRLVHVQRQIEALKPHAVILLGDIEAPRPLHELLTGCEVYFIPGNHDSDDEMFFRHLFESEYGKNNLHNRVVEIAGIRVAGLGGVFHEGVWMPPSDPKFDNLEEWASLNQWTDKHFEAHKKMHTHGTIMYDDYLNLMMEKADVLVAHDAPSCHPYGFEALDDLARELGVHTMFHGDHHDNLDYSEDEALMGFRTYGVGLRGITDIHGRVVVEGELDRDRFESRMEKKRTQQQNFKSARPRI